MKLIWNIAAIATCSFSLGLWTNTRTSDYKGMSIKVAYMILLALLIVLNVVLFITNLKGMVQ